MKTLVTGAAGFIGFHMIRKLLGEGYEVFGIDNINDYYSPQLKHDRLHQLGIKAGNIVDHKRVKSDLYPSFTFVKADLRDKEQLFDLFKSEAFDDVINLAAQAGVRYSIENPDVYIQSNVLGFYNILEACRHFPVKHLLHASSSSVYGANSKIPFSEDDNVDSPVSLYAATKKSNELLAYSYNSLYHIPVTCLRFFTVYGPWGRPDMAPMLFAKAIQENKPIKVFNNGQMERDFTYIDDIVEGIYKVLTSDSIKESSYHVFNIGHGSPVNLGEFIRILESEMGKVAEKIYLPMQPGDVEITWADQRKLFGVTGYRPEIKLEKGIHDFVEWFREYYSH